MRKYTPSEFIDVPENAVRVFKGVIHDIYHWEQEQFDGTFKTFELLKRPDTVITIPVADGKLLLSEEEQPHIGKFINFPGGRHDNEAEDELEAAKRELKEETGYTFKNWKLIVAYQPRGHFSYVTYIFLATGVIKVGEQILDTGERINVIEKTFDEYKSMKYGPELRNYHDDIFDDIHSIDELLAMPSLYDYGN